LYNRGGMKESDPLPHEIQAAEKLLEQYAKDRLLRTTKVWGAVLLAAFALIIASYIEFRYFGSNNLIGGFAMVVLWGVVTVLVLAVLGGLAWMGLGLAQTEIKCGDTRPRAKTCAFIVGICSLSLGPLAALFMVGQKDIRPVVMGIAALGWICMGCILIGYLGTHYLTGTTR